MTTKTLNQTWDLCLQMWKWIAETYDGTISVWALKQTWLNDNGFADIKLYGNCFFCGYDSGCGFDSDNPCRNCPGRLVDPDFYCAHPNYNFRDKPVEFYNELLRLNQIRIDIKHDDDEDYRQDLIKQADSFGMESLTEDEQAILE